MLKTFASVVRRLAGLTRARR